MAVYNGEKYLHEQLDSIRQQLSSQDEMVIVDDCSTDSTVDLINKMVFPCPVKLYLMRNNLGPRNAFQYAIERSSGKYILLSDQDDIWISGRVDRYIEVLGSANHDVVIGNAVFIDERGVATGSDIFSIFRPSLSLFMNIIKPTYCGALMGFRGTIKKWLLPFPQPVYMHDMWLGIYAVLKKRSLVIDDVLTKYRRHDQAFTKKRNSIWNKLKWRMSYMLAVLVMYSRLRTYVDK